MRNGLTLWKSAFVAAAAGGLLMFAAPSAADAQGVDHRWDVSLGAGSSFATSDFADLPFGDLAPTAGAEITYWLSPRIGIQANGNWERWLTDDQQLTGGPDMNAFHYTLGATVNVLDPEQRLNVRANVAGGGTTLDTEMFLTPDDMLSELSETYASVNGGLRVGYDVTSQVNVFARGQAHLVLADEDDTQVLASLSEDVQSFDEIWTFPTTVGLEISF